MKFSELEKIMQQKGAVSLASIARYLNTTPQAVSNWKSRDQIPNHIIIKVNQTTEKQSITFLPNQTNFQNQLYKEDITLSDLLLTLSEQLKLIIILPLISVFLTFTYVQFIEKPIFVSSATVLFPENSSSSFRGLAGFASQIGVDVPAQAQEDLSSPSLIPDLLISRRFAANIFEKKFYFNNEKNGETLIEILKREEGIDNSDTKRARGKILQILSEMIEIEKSSSGNFNIIKASSFDPSFSKELVEVVIDELENLNRYFKNQSVNEKTKFIEERINNVENDLKISEKYLKNFNENNRQISSPSLQLELDRLTRNVEVQKGIYLTLKQQLELSKIEEVQRSSIVQILDFPELPLSPSNKNLKIDILLSMIVSLGFAVLMAIFRSSLINSNFEQRRKIKKIKNFLLDKSKGIFRDQKFVGTIILLLVSGMPFYFGHRSEMPIFFGRYSLKLMIVNSFYLLIFIIFILLFFKNKKIKHD